MRKASFPGGVHPPENKLTSHISIKEFPIPDEVVIPLQQHIGAPNQPLVKKGDRVFTGTLIGKSEKYISSPIFSSITGVVEDIGNYPHPVLKRAPAIRIRREGEDELDPVIKPPSHPEELTPEELRRIVWEKGIVGMGGAAFPTHVKLSPPPEKKIDTLIINGAECEPYLTCDERLMIERGEEIVRGVEIIVKILSPKRVIIAIEDNKPEAIEKMRKCVEGKGNFEVKELKTKYPQGGEKQLIKALLNREVPSGGLPFDVGVLVQNVGTCLAIFEAVYKGKPLYERVVTVSGQVENPGNYKVRLGTAVRKVIEWTGGWRENGDLVIFGGPMMGIAQSSLDVPVIKGTTGILFLQSEKWVEYPCVRCGRCVDVCPVRLIPTQIMKAVKFGNIELLKEYHVLDCIECGSCAYICPAQIPLVQYVKVGKEILRRKK